MLVIRKIKVEDATSIQLLSNQLGYPISEEETRNQIISILNNQNDYAILAINDNIVCAWLHGFIAIRLESLPFAEIGGLVVNEQYRNQGIAKNLIYEFTQWCESKNIHKIRVRCNVIRTETHLFYTKLGFVENKSQKVLDLRI